MGHYWNKNYICPFYTSSMKRKIKCEVGGITFPDKASIIMHVDMYCASYDWEKCPQAKDILKRYEAIL